MGHFCDVWIIFLSIIVHKGCSKYHFEQATLQKEHTCMVNYTKCTGIENIPPPEFCMGITNNTDCCTCLFKGDDFSLDKTVCFMQDRKDAVLQLEEITNLNHDRIQHMIIIVQNVWEGFYPLNTLGINLTNIANLNHLLSLTLYQCNSKNLQPYPLLYGNTTFEDVKQIEEIHIQMAVYQSHLSNMVKFMRNLKVLDLSYTKCMAMELIHSAIANLNNDTTEKLILRNFQNIGLFRGYNGSVDIVELLSNKTFTKLEYLDIRGNAIYRLVSNKYAGISTLAPNLKYLDISDNLLLDSVNTGFIMEAYLHPQIEYFYMHHQGFSRDQTDKHNDISKLSYVLQDEILSPGVSLRGWAHILSCFNNNNRNHNNTNSNISELFYNCTINDKIHAIKDEYNILKCILPVQFDYDIPYSVFPQINMIINTSCIYGLNLPIGKNLKELDMSDIHWEQSVTLGNKHDGNLCFNTNNLTTVFVSGNSKWIKSSELEYTVNHIKSLSGLHNLKYLYVSDNDLDIDLSLIINGSHLPALTELYASKNNFRLDQNLCQEQTLITIFDFSYNNLQNISENVIYDCYNLTVLNLAGNLLKSKNFTNINLENNKQLQVLNLSANKLETLSQNILNQLEILASKSCNLTVDLSNNPLKCGCTPESLQFAKWFSKYITKNETQNQTCLIKFHDIEKYVCDNSKGLTQLSVMDKSYKLIHSQCVKTYTEVILTTLGLTFMSLIAAFSIFAICRYRWRIRYRVFKIKNYFQKRNQMPQVYKYDAFVSYCAEDRFWVHSILMKTLEEDYGFQLCIHYRDFPVGGDIPETIIEMMQKSRDIIIVLSNIAVKSQWCQFEIDQALIREGRRGRRIIIIKLGDEQIAGQFEYSYDSDEAQDGDLPRLPLLEYPTVAHLLDTHNYLEWVDNINAEKFFWAKLVAALYGDAEGCSCICPFGTKAIRYDNIYDTDD